MTCGTANYGETGYLMLQRLAIGRAPCPPQAFPGLRRTDDSFVCELYITYHTTRKPVKRYNYS